MTARIDLVGRRFGRLLVLSRVEGARLHRWICRCDCGTVKEIPGGPMLLGISNSCGCYRVEVTMKRATVHGAKHSREYNAWCEIKRRCYNQHSKSYKDYGGRGIQMCERWRTDFRHFLADVGPCPTNHSIDRIDVNGDYAPDNCRWADLKTQRNNRRDNHLLTVNGITHTLTEWANALGCKKATTIWYRLKNGWDPERAVSIPPLKRSEWSTSRGKSKGR